MSELIVKHNNFVEANYNLKTRKLTGIKAMELLNLKRNTFYRLIREFEE